MNTTRTRPGAALPAPVDRARASPPRGDVAALPKRRAPKSRAMREMTGRWPETRVISVDAGHLGGRAVPARERARERARAAGGGRRGGRGTREGRQDAAIRA